MPGTYATENIIRLLVAMVLGGIIGFERELHDRPAGLRTHILVCVGSALVMIVSQHVSLSFADKLQSDPARIAAQVVSGIGFLGAGTIMREGATVRGLTTAASLWISAALGLAAGAGLYVYAAFASVLTLIALSLMSQMEHYLALQRSKGEVSLIARDRPGLLGQIGSVLGELELNIVGVRLTPHGDEEVQINFYVDYSSQTEKLDLLEQLEKIPGLEVKQMKVNLRE